ncbi:hypothetical protein EV421DRAFT_1763950 [Armillaria borealis]|uniref:Uncharacterized protein n=1 Tax=Armillaria borealis TaxID=47425 RepID=A0AA39K4W9_9AGAR|nr:hypothetical protein EV421DRAFT_1763950 [Armillaria borealis]
MLLTAMFGFTCCLEIGHQADLNHVLGTRGVGKGLDDESLDPALKATGLVIFLHPYYGVDSQAFEKTTDTFCHRRCSFPFDWGPPTAISRLASWILKFMTRGIITVYSALTLCHIMGRIISPVSCFETGS